MPQVPGWNWEPSILIGLAIWVGAYLAAAGPLRGRFRTSQPVPRAKMILFLLSALVILVALLSPLDELGDQYLFSAHMIQHLMLTIVMPPLLLLGVPGWMPSPALKSRLVKKVAQVLTHPIVAFSLFNLVFLVWHVPVLYEATLHNENVHIFEHLLFMSTGVLNWWPILSPMEELPRPSYPIQVLYLFLDAIPATILGGIIVFAPNILYPTYAAAPRLWGLSAMDDQQYSGVIMSMPGAMVYLFALAAVFFKWFATEDQSERQRPARPPLGRITGN